MADDEPKTTSPSAAPHGKHPIGLARPRSRLSFVLTSGVFLALIAALVAMQYMAAKGPRVSNSASCPSDGSQKISSLSLSLDSKLMTKAQLAQYDGVINDKIYLSVLGSIFDVTKGSRFYARGEGYSNLTGKDGSKSFVTGRFTVEGGDLTDDLTGLTDEQLAGVVNWRRFYEKDYTSVGRLIDGPFYDSMGVETEELLRVLRAAEVAASEQTYLERIKKDLPPCDTRWSDADGGWVSCEGREGLRPRLVSIPAYHQGGAPIERCACMEGDGWSDQRKIYKDCEPDAQKCQTSPSKQV